MIFSIVCCVWKVLGLGFPDRILKHYVPLLSQLSTLDLQGSSLTALKNKSFVCIGCNEQVPFLSPPESAVTFLPQNADIACKMESSEARLRIQTKT